MANHSSMNLQTTPQTTSRSISMSKSKFRSRSRGSTITSGSASASEGMISYANPHDPIKSSSAYTTSSEGISYAATTPFGTGKHSTGKKSTHSNSKAKINMGHTRTNRNAHKRGNGNASGSGNHSIRSGGSGSASASGSGSGITSSRTAISNSSASHSKSKSRILDESILKCIDSKDDDSDNFNISLDSSSSDEEHYGYDASMSFGSSHHHTYGGAAQDSFVGGVSEAGGLSVADTSFGSHFSYDRFTGLHPDKNGKGGGNISSKFNARMNNSHEEENRHRAITVNRVKSTTGGDDRSGHDHGDGDEKKLDDTFSNIEINVHHLPIPEEEKYTHVHFPPNQLQSRKTTRHLPRLTVNTAHTLAYCKINKSFSHSQDENDRDGNENTPSKTPLSHGTAGTDPMTPHSMEQLHIHEQDDDADDDGGFGEFPSMQESPQLHVSTIHAKRADHEARLGSHSPLPPGIPRTVKNPLYQRNNIHKGLRSTTTPTSTSRWESRSPQSDHHRKHHNDSIDTSTSNSNSGELSSSLSTTVLPSFDTSYLRQRQFTKKHQAQNRSYAERDYYNTLMKERILQHGPHSLPAAKAMTSLGSALLRCNTRQSFEDALAVYKRAMVILKFYCGEESLIVAKVLDKIGTSASLSYAHASARHEKQKQRQSRSTSRRSDGSVSVHSSSSSTSRSNNAIRMPTAGEIATTIVNDDTTVLEDGEDEYDDSNLDWALIALKEALAIRVSYMGPHHPDCVDTLNNIAGVYLHKKDWATARTLYLDVLTTRAAIFGRNHGSIAVTAQTLGKVFVRLSEFRNALLHYNLALEIYQGEGMQLRDGHPLVVRVRKSIASTEHLMKSLRF